MKKEFIPAELEVVIFNTNVISTSDPTEGEDDPVTASVRVGL